MTTILNPGFESGYTNWSTANNGAGGSGISTTIGVTEGSNSMRTTMDAVVDRPVGGYFYMTQSIVFNSDFTLLFDFYDSASSDFDVTVLIDNDLILATQLSGGGQNTDESAVISGYSGSHTLKIGIKNNTTTSSAGNVYLDNLRVTNETPTGINININIGDVWKVSDAVKINIGDTWKEVVSVKQNIGDTWKTVF